MVKRNKIKNNNKNCENFKSILIKNTIFIYEFLKKIIFINNHHDRVLIKDKYGDEYSYFNSKNLRILFRIWILHFIL